MQHNLLWMLLLLLLYCNRPERVICLYDRSDVMHANRKLFPIARTHGQNPNTKNDKHPLSFKSSLSQICSAAVFGIYDACPATPWASAVGHYERQRNELKGPVVWANMCLEEAAPACTVGNPVFALSVQKNESSVRAWAGIILLAWWDSYRYK